MSETPQDKIMNANIYDASQDRNVDVRQLRITNLERALSEARAELAAEIEECETITQVAFDLREQLRAVEALLEAERKAREEAERNHMSACNELQRSFDRERATQNELNRREQRANPHSFSRRLGAQANWDLLRNQLKSYEQRAAELADVTLKHQVACDTIARMNRDDAAIATEFRARELLDEGRCKAIGALQAELEAERKAREQERKAREALRTALSRVLESVIPYREDGTSVLSDEVSNLCNEALK